jgi:ribosome-binding ATPase YchF (GTP1/OBG family)
MKIGIFQCDNFSTGKESIVDCRLDTIKQMAHSSKKSYVEAEVLVDPERLKQSNGIIIPKDKQADLILTDLEFVEKRLSNAQDEKERNLLNRLKEQLEKEHFIWELELSEEENKAISEYSLLSCKPVFMVEPPDLEDKPKVLSLAYIHFGYISFFTANEKEAHAWPIKKGTTCWQAAGLIHSDIQKGFIRAEVIGFNDLINDGSINQARTNNHQRLENKDYIVQDGDLIKFRFSK